MIKKILLVLLILAVAAVIAVYLLGSSMLNKVIKSGVETMGPQVTQTSVTLDEVDISVLSSDLTLKGLRVGNPDGFKNENIFSLGQIDVDIVTSTILEDTIIIDTIYISQPEISYEKTLMSSNINKLLENIKDFTGEAEEAEEAAEEAGTPEDDTAQGKKVVIKQFVIEEGTIYVGALGVGQAVKLPRIELNNIGEPGNEMSIAEVTELVLKKVLASIGPAIADAGDLLKGSLDDAAKAYQESGAESLGEAADDALNKASEGIKGLFGK